MTSVLQTTQSGNIRILELLLRGPVNGDDVEKALFHACRHGLTDCVNCLLAAGVDPNVEDGSGNTPLHHAVGEGHTDIVRALCAAKAEVNRRGAGHSVPIHLAVKWGKDDCLEMLLSHGCDIDARDSSQATPLIMAVRGKQYLAIGQLLEAGCHANAQDVQGRTALHYASHTAVSVERLLDAGADVNIQDKDGCTPLIMAASEGLERVVSSLTRIPSCNPNLVTFAGRRSPLHILASKGHFRSVVDLISCGADMTSVDADGKTALWHAVAHKRTKVVVVLMQYSTRVTETACRSPGDDGCHCPVRLAFDKGLLDIIQLFISCNYDSRHMRECLSQGQGASLFEQDRYWLHLGQQVTSLQQTCRKCLRHSLAPNLQKKCSKLPIPSRLIDFILFKDFDEYLEK